VRIGKGEEIRFSFKPHTPTGREKSNLEVN